jgi:hypothetical protein
MDIPHDPPELILDLTDSVELAHDGVFIHDIDPLVPEVPEDFMDAERLLFPPHPNPANVYINDPFMRDWP